MIVLTAEATSDEDFQNSLRDTLKTISEKAQNVVGQESNLSEEELARIWSNLNIDPEEDPNGGSGGFANLMPLMTNMMQNLLSKELLYPALSELVEKVRIYKTLQISTQIVLFFFSIRHI